MSTPKMHPDEIDIDGPLVARLIANQFPHWAHLPIAKVASAGTDNAVYRLGDDMAVRLPRLPRAAEMVGKEQRWLPRLAPLLPLAVPVPLGAGTADDRFPYPWSVCQWLPGRDLSGQPDVDPHDTAIRLGQFVAALQRIDTADGPSSTRAEPVSARDDGDVRSTIRHLSTNGAIDAGLATAVWETALATPAWHGPPLWIHGDLLPANLLATQGRLTAVIDFGLLGLGDPAWARGQGWALSAGLGAVRVYRVTNPVLAAAGQHAITETIADYRDTA